MDTWRFLPLEVNDAFTNMAIDEAMLESRIQGKTQNTIRFYRWNPSAVSIGRFQSVEKEVNLGACKRLGIDIVRRVSGGGAVYHDFTRELTYSVIVDCGNERITTDVLTSYKGVCDGILKGLASLGVNVELEAANPSQRCPNIMIDGRKVSGNAQARRRGVLLQHGTVLIDLDIQTMLEVLRNPKLIMNETIVEFVRKRITTLSRELKREVDLEEVVTAMKKGFSEAFDISLAEGNLTTDEVNLARELKTTRYGSDAWNYGTPQSGSESESCLNPRTAAVEP